MLARLSALALLAAPVSAQTLPGNAVGFVHIRAAEIWKHDLMKSLRDTVQAAGPKALTAFQEQMYPNPADIDDVTAVVLPGNGSSPMDLVVSVAFKKAIDAEKIRKLYLPDAATNESRGRKFYLDRDKDVGLHFPDKQHLVAGPAKALEAYLAAKGESVLAPAFAVAQTKAFTMAVNVKSLPIPPQAFDQIPPDLRPLARVERAVLSLDLGVPDPVIEFRAAYAGDAAAMDAEKALKAAIAMGKEALKQPKSEMEKKLYEHAGKGPQPIQVAAEAGGALLGLGGMNRLEAELDRLPISRSGPDLAAKVVIPKEATQISGLYTGVMAGLLLPAIQKTRMAAGSSMSANNMKQIGLAFLNVDSAIGKLPSAAICDANGKPLLSWRVAILPYIDEDALYKQFKLDEPWDSANNKPLVAKMPKVYHDPRVPTRPGETVYKVFVGKEAICDWKTGRTIASISDGCSNTIMAIEGGDPVIWSKPDDLLFDSAKPLPKLELPGGVKVVNVLMADGSVRRIDLGRVSEKTLKIAIGAADGEVLPDDWDTAGK